MRVGNLAGRLAIITDEGAIDVETCSGGRFGPDPQSVFEVWEEFVAWAADAPLKPAVQFALNDLGAPTPTPGQIFAVGLNFTEHAAESKFEVPEHFPPVFTKFRSSLSGPVTTVILPEGNVDWEVELVAVIGRRAENVSAENAWSFVAGLMVGQDLSERVTQLRGPAPQFSLGKSFPGFAPIGPWLVTVDEFPNPDDLAMTCALDGEVMQKGRTSGFIFGVPALIEGLSHVTPLMPGDIIFCGTPSGVGVGRDPQRFIQPGEELVSSIEGIGQLRQKFASL